MSGGQEAALSQLAGRVVTGQLPNGDELGTGARDLLAVSSVLGRSITEVAGVIRFRAGARGGIFEPKVAADLVLLLRELRECCHVVLRLWVGVVVVGGAECWRWVTW